MQLNVKWGTNLFSAFAGQFVDNKGVEDSSGGQGSV